MILWFIVRMYSPRMPKKIRIIELIIDMKIISGAWPAINLSQ
jgi:hypothetical protein